MISSSWKLISALILAFKIVSLLEITDLSYFGWIRQAKNSVKYLIFAFSIAAKKNRRKINALAFHQTVMITYQNVRKGGI